MHWAVPGTIAGGQTASTLPLGVAGGAARVGAIPRVGVASANRTKTAANRRGALEILANPGPLAAARRLTTGNSNALNEHRSYY
jgi:hypothetical protein